MIDPVDAYHAHQLNQEVRDLKVKLDAAYRALESLTPGGSEFHESPDNCVRFVKNKLKGMHATLMRHKGRHQ